MCESGFVITNKWVVFHNPPPRMGGLESVLCVGVACKQATPFVVVVAVVVVVVVVRILLGVLNPDPGSQSPWQTTKHSVLFGGHTTRCACWLSTTGDTSSTGGVFSWDSQAPNIPLNRAA